MTLLQLCHSCLCGKMRDEKARREAWCALLRGTRAGLEPKRQSREEYGMSIGEVIRKYRKINDMTQEEMANRLGVTAPAVNKWEKGNSLPDVAMLVPIARLLGISLDTLLSFREELTAEETGRMIYELNAMLREGAFEEAFAWSKKKAEQFPNCDMLILQMAVLLNAELMKKKDDSQEKYERCIVGWFNDMLKSRQEQVRTMAADSLFNHYLNKEQYEKAQECLSYFSEQNPERKRKQAVLYDGMGRRGDAYKAYEELLFSSYREIDLIFHSIFRLAVQDGDLEKARSMIQKQKTLAALFEMGVHHEALADHELALLEKDVEAVVSSAEKLFESLEHIHYFTKAPLYGHLTFCELEKAFLVQVKEDVLKSLCEEETYGFLRGNERWENLIKDVRLELKSAK